MKKDLVLTWGLPYQDGIFKNVVVRPLTIGGELNALAAFDDFADGKELDKNSTSVAMTLAYWTQQVEFGGVPAEALTVDYLMHNLVGEDYRLIMEAMDELRAKSAAATVIRVTTAAAETNHIATGQSTETTGES